MRRGSGTACSEPPPTGPGSCLPAGRRSARRFALPGRITDQDAVTESRFRSRTPLISAQKRTMGSMDEPASRSDSMVCPLRGGVLLLFFFSLLFFTFLFFFFAFCRFFFSFFSFIFSVVFCRPAAVFQENLGVASLQNLQPQIKNSEGRATLGRPKRWAGTDRASAIGSNRRLSCQPARRTTRKPVSGVEAPSSPELRRASG